ncbi:unnamed protein product [Clonostachys rosea]|uniref:Uncharacterized protein n=1 Tax=Bionectria ochroleuca TaxID=29856 RepID=A0ABY6URI1_BIOOC|nr:unnamed protein product [Clonostachys rosea]
MSVFQSFSYDTLMGIGEALGWHDLNNLAKANSFCYDLFNRQLYSRHSREDPPHRSCIFWAIDCDNIGTIRKALEYGADPDTRVSQIPNVFYHVFFPNWREAESRESVQQDENTIEDAVEEETIEDAVEEEMTEDAVEEETIEDLAEEETTEDEVEEEGTEAATKPSFTPLQFAVRFGRREIVKYLLQHGADANSTFKGSCRCYGGRDIGLLHILNIHNAWYTTEEAQDMAKTLIEHGARESAQGRSVIYETISNGDIVLFDFVAAHHGIEIGATDAYGRNLLQYTLECSDGPFLPLCRRLLDRGVAVNHRDRLGRTPFSSIPTSGITADYVQAAILLLEHGADYTAAFAPPPDPDLELDPDDVIGHHPPSMLDTCVLDIKDYPSVSPWEEHAEFVEEQTQRTRLVKMLLERGMPQNPTPGSQCRDRALNRALFGAAAHLKDVNCMQMLLDTGARADSTIGRGVGRDEWPILVAFVKHEARAWGHLTFDEIPVEISIVRRLRLLLDNGAPLGPVASTGEQVEIRLPTPADGAEGQNIMQLVDEDDEELYYDDEEIEEAWDSYYTHSLDLSEFSEGPETESPSAMRVAFELAASDKKASHHPDVGFQLNDVFLDIFCEYATSRNITEEHLSDLIKEYDEEELEDESSDREPSGRLKAAWDKLVQFRERLFPGRH